MIGIRHEKYEALMGNLPFSLQVDIERSVYNYSREQNWHENPEIQFFTSGTGAVLLNGKKYTVKKGDIVVVNSNVIHYTATDSNLKYCCLIISTDWCKRMAIEYESINFKPILNDPFLFEFLNEIIYIYSHTEINMRVARANEVLLKLFIYLADNYTETSTFPSSESRHFKIVKEAITFMQKNYNTKITLEEIAKSVLYDKYALCKIFKKCTGQTITENLNCYRSLKAIEFLTEGYTVAETAYMCGFNNISFFTKTFKRHIGKNPSFYKKSED